MLGGRWRRRRGEWGRNATQHVKMTRWVEVGGRRGELEKKATQRVKWTRWVAVGVVVEGSRVRMPPNVSR